jgi:ABC-2 type transport system ATP-binding protein
MYEKLTGREFLYFIGGIFSMRVAVVKERIGEYIEMFELGDFIDKRGEEYSQGMRQRIVLSAAMIHDPGVLIIDEPLVGLDPRSSRLVKDTLKQRTTQGLTIFMSTHLLEIVEELCDRIAIIKQGRIIYEESRGGARRSNGQLETMFLELTK